ncbi:MAG: FecR domain-containing protein [Patescibacteria group bacterium]|nr:FecR domain-containing protein [Patescibacteria group bacterium]MDD5490408.1 FecR domain-containing protein [Patescibacteria group bacterium]
MFKNQEGKTSFSSLILGFLVIVLLGIVVLQVKENIDLKVSLKNNEEQASTSEKITPLALNLSWQQGKVFVEEPGADFTTVETGVLLKEGWAIKLDKNARAILEFASGGVLRLDGGAEIVLTKLSKEEIVLTQISGSSYHRVIVDENGVYKIDSLGQTIVALGTAFNVACDKDGGALKVDVIENKVKVEIKKEGKVKEEKTVEAGQGAKVDSAKELAEVAKLTEADLKTDWYLWNKEEDSKKSYELGVLKDIKKDEELKEEENEEDEGAGSSAEENKKSEYLTLWGTAQDDGIHLSWTPYAGDNFSYYKIVRSENNPDLKYPADGYIKVSSDKSFSSSIDSTAKKGAEYYYRICAKIGEEIKCGNVIQRTAVNESKEEETEKKDEAKNTFTLVENALNLSVEAKTDGIHLSWTPYAGTDFSYGKVVRSETNANLYYPNDGYIKVLNDKESVAYLDSSAKGGTDYYYRICVKTSSGEVKCGNVMKIKAATAGGEETSQTEGFKAITGELQLSVSKASDGVHLSWTPRAGEGFMYYKVVRSETNPDLYYPNDGYIKYSTKRTFNSYLDADIAAGKTYYYRVCSKEESGEVWCGNVVTVNN